MSLLKQILILIAVSLVVVIFQSEVAAVLGLFAKVHHWIAGVLTNIFTTGKLGNIIRNSIALFVFPFFLAGVVSLVYWAIKRSRMPHFMLTFWILWLVQTAVVLK